MNNRELFFRHLAQTSPAPLALEIIRAEGCWLYGANGESYLDLIGGISVANMGHRHPRVVEAIKEQTDAYLHVLVYGEFIQSPQVQYARLLASLLPPSLDTVYFTNSGAEAVEGAMKLSKRVTGRSQVIAFKNAYHGSTQGALSIMGDEYWRNAFRPLLPDVLHLNYNKAESLEQITQRAACVIIEPVQAESGVQVPDADWLKELREKCNAVGALLILDEIQTGFGRTGTLWSFERSGAVPDVLLLGKALGGGMPLGAFIANKSLMDQLTKNPVLGHITTFGGHPVCTAAGLASMRALLEEERMGEVKEKERLFTEHLSHPRIQSVRSAGLMIAVEFADFAVNKKVIDACIARGVLTDWFLLAPHCMRIAPPLVISKEEIEQACAIICEALADF